MIEYPVVCDTCRWLVLRYSVFGDGSGGGCGGGVGGYGSGVVTEVKISLKYRKAVLTS